MDILQTRIIDVPDLDQPVRIDAIGDLHLMEAGCAVDKLSDDIAAVADDDSAAVILMGDLAGCIAPDDAKRWDPSSVPSDATIADLNDWGGACVRRIVRAVEPIAHKVIGCIEGNHESAYRRRKQQDITRAVAGALGVRSIGYSCMATIRFRCRKHYRDLAIIATHGSSGAATIGGKAMALQRQIDIFTADIVFMGHVHDSFAYYSVRLHQDGERIGEHETLGVITGTYLRTYELGHSGYGEQRGYRPVKLGHTIVQVVPSAWPQKTMVGWS